MVTENCKEREGEAQESLDDFKVIAPQRSFCRWGLLDDLQEKSSLARAGAAFGGFALTWPIQCPSNTLFSDYQGTLTSHLQTFSYLH